DNGVYTVTVAVTDDNGGSGSDTVQVTVNNVAPAVNAGADATANEGAAFSQSGSFADPGADTWTATVDYGDGSGVQALALSGKTFTLNHVYADNGVYTVTVAVTDDNGGSGSDTVQVTVNNVAPTITEASWNNGCDLEVAVTYTDPAGVLDEPYDLTINWSITSCTISTAAPQVCSTEGYQQTVSDYASGDSVSLLGYTPPGGTTITNREPTRVEVSDKDNGSNATNVISDNCNVPG
ncbi:MAG: PKD domain-containing protein, partial [Methylomicrobium sp.]